MISELRTYQTYVQPISQEVRNSDVLLYYKKWQLLSPHELYWQQGKQTLLVLLRDTS